MTKDLFELGMTGEGLLDDRVWLVKSHYPERLGHSPLKVNKAILLVRSPLDSLWSFFNMMCTQSHNKSIPEEKMMGGEMKEYWEMFVRDEIETWC